VSANLVDEEIGHEEQTQAAQTHCEVREVGLVNLQDCISLKRLITRKKRSSGVGVHANKSNSSLWTIFCRRDERV